ncbi:hypothetical protein K1719_019985 [Acacia pycnantha]|nr:hypothetical protein K1719_019985 [Acacia pycnantha]
MFRYTIREILSRAVMRAVMNLACPRFINERIESIVINMTKVNKSTTAVQDASDSKEEGLLNSIDPFSVDPSVTGVELVQLRNGTCNKNTVICRR